MLRRLIGQGSLFRAWHSDRLKPSDFAPPAPLLPWGFAEPPADQLNPPDKAATAAASQMLLSYGTDRHTVTEGAILAYRTVTAEFGHRVFDKTLPGVSPALGALLNDWLASHLRNGCWPMLELSGDIKASICAAEVRPGSADHGDKILGLSPREAKQHLLEGALGPEYRYATEGSGPRRLCVDVLMEAACEMRCQPLSPAVASIAAQLDVQKLPLTVFVPPAPPAPLPKHIWSFEADVLEDDVSLGPWQLFNINHVLKEP